ncbi:MAG TPA: hypothetical protein VMV86_05320 [Methanosarcinales archaeon]|nr:hypothetical protein [Methanosarcinales archaeon]
MPIKDYSSIENITKGAQMAMQVMGIKDQREQNKLLNKFKQQQMGMQVKADERAERSSIINEKNANAELKMKEAQLKEFELNAGLRQMQAEDAQAEMQQKQISRVRADLYKHEAGNLTANKDFEGLARLIMETSNPNDMALNAQRLGIGGQETIPTGQVGQFYQVHGRKPTPKEYKEMNESTNYDKNILIAAQSVGISPEVVKAGKLTKDDAMKVMEAYKAAFGAESLLSLLLKSGTTSNVPTIKYDEKGNRIQ